MVKRMKLGIMMRVFNRGKRTSANSHYIAVWIKDPELRTYTPLLLTQSELRRAGERVNKNKEDMPFLDMPKPRVPFWRRFIRGRL
jgi:hypothetical protein|tara:strand:+ start:336 stop:590 length:255 start_codon:yes stop_codon:yes gene_type:complete